MLLYKIESKPDNFKLLVATLHNLHTKPIWKIKKDYLQIMILISQPDFSLPEAHYLRHVYKS